MRLVRKNNAKRRFKRAALVGAGTLFCCILTLKFAVESEADDGLAVSSAIIQMFFFAALSLGGTALYELYQGYMSLEEERKQSGRERAEGHFLLACHRLRSEK